jgi:hypothetical protein
MDILDEEILELWRLLNENKVDYIMVGGFATTLHGFSRNTADIDIWIRDTLENRQALRKTLKDLEIGDFQSIESTQFIPGFTSIILNSGIELDIMTSLIAFDQIQFEECFKLSPIADIEGIPVRFLHINQLIESKRAAGRAKDLIDIEELERIRKDAERK